MRRKASALLLVLLAPGLAAAASLDVTAQYKMQEVVYKNLDMGQDVNNQSLLENDARIGFAVKKIALDAPQGDDSTMDVGILLHALGVSGSTNALAIPFNRAAQYYPTSNLTPFIENAYVRVNRLWGYPIDATFGRQSYRLGSGLLLDDDGAGFTGVVVREELPWFGLKTEEFVFQDKNPTSASPNSLTLAGFSVNLPTEGTWQLNELVEKDQSNQLVYGCGDANTANDPAQTAGCEVSKAFRSFTSARYQISYGPMVFDGEAALEKGVATPTGLNPATNHITYDADAEVVRMKWKQSLYHTGEGIARLTLARGSGNSGNPTTDQAFYPSHGHQYDGLERSGFGDFYGATPYSAFGGNYSTSTKSGLPQNASGITTVGIGYTTPSYHSFVLDVDGYLYQATRAQNFGSTLGDEVDFHLRYPIRDQFVMSAGLAYFKAGLITDPNQSIARKFTLQATGRF